MAAGHSRSTNLRAPSGLQTDVNKRVQRTCSPLQALPRMRSLKPREGLPILPPVPGSIEVTNLIDGLERHSPALCHHGALDEDKLEQIAALPPARAVTAPGPTAGSGSAPRGRRHAAWCFGPRKFRSYEAFCVSSPFRRTHGNLFVSAGPGLEYASLEPAECTQEYRDSAGSSKKWRWTSFMIEPQSPGPLIDGCSKDGTQLLVLVYRFLDRFLRWPNNDLQFQRLGATCA